MKQIKRLPVEDIKARVNILDVVGDTVELHKTGSAYLGMCPFHNNQRTPALAVFPATGTWYCFGACGAGGDVISFVMKRDNLPFQEACRVLALRAGIALPEDSPDLKRMYEILGYSACIYNDVLLNHPSAKYDLQYLQMRKISVESIKLFHVGQSYSAGHFLVDALVKAGYTEEECISAGIAYRDKEGFMWDTFRDRITFPIRDPQGNVLGFAGRATRPDQQPKFLNSHNNDVFDKSACLYGIDQAWPEIKKRDSAIVVEGYFDVIAMHQMGYQNTVAVMGTSLSEDQVRVLKQYTKNITMLMDGDQAGEKAVRQLISASKIEAVLEDHPQFDAGSVLRSERKFGVNISVAVLPTGTDPDELDLDMLFKIIDAKRPLVNWLIERVCRDSLPNESPRSKAAKVNDLAKVVALVPDAVERDGLMREVSELFSVDYQAVKSAVANTVTHRAQAGENPTSYDSVTCDNSSVMESEFVKAVIPCPTILYDLDRQLRYAGLEPVTPYEFYNSAYRDIMDTVKKSLEQDEVSADEFLKKTLTEENQKLLEVEDCFEDYMHRLGYLIDTICCIRVAMLNRIIEAATQSEMPPEEKAGKIAGYVLDKRIIERALKSLKEKATNGKSAN